jgi:hypothetical protein
MEKGLAAKIIEIFPKISNYLPGVGGALKITKEISTATNNELLIQWHKIKDWFIIENDKIDQASKELIEKYESDHSNAEVSNELKRRIEEKLRNDKISLSYIKETINSSHVNSINTVRGTKNKISQKIEDGQPSTKKSNKIAKVIGNENQINQSIIKPKKYRK